MSIHVIATKVYKQTVLLFGALLCVACATSDQRLTPAVDTPAALGTIKTTEDEHGNTELDVKVDHLAEPAMLAPELRTFVVWIRPDGGEEFLNVGQLEIDDQRSGELETKTPHRDFEVVVTGEASSTPRYPSRHVVLKGHSQR